MDTYTFGQRLKRLRKKRGLLQKDLADQLHVAITTISGYEHGRIQPSMPILAQLARILDTSVDYLLGITDDPSPKWHEQLYSNDELKVIPVYNGAHAGNIGEYPDGSTIVEYVQIPRNMRGQFGVKVVGDSMEPEFFDGDIVIVDPDAPIRHNDRVVVILSDPYFVEPSAVVKIYREGINAKYLHSRNEKYSPILLTPGVRVHFVGRVVGLVRRY